MTPTEARTIFRAAAAELIREPASIFAARVAITFAREYGSELQIASDVVRMLHGICLCGETEACSVGLLDTAARTIRIVEQIEKESAAEREATPTVPTRRYVMMDDSAYDCGRKLSDWEDIP